MCRPDYSGAVISHADPDRALRARHYPIDPIAPLSGALNSTTWMVDTPSGRSVAKPVDDVDADGPVTSLRIAEFSVRVDSGVARRYASVPANSPSR